ASQNGGAVGNAFVSGHGQYPLQGGNGMGMKVHEFPEELPCIGCRIKPITRWAEASGSIPEWS
ncbi:hypothetical protein LJB63_25795, partial [[Eubacterium] rectale]|nr:hypothetical protein [Agathobacter rectalis]